MSRGRRLPLFLAALLVAGAASRAGESALDRAQSLRKRYEIRAAERIYLDLLEEDPESYDALVGLAKVAGLAGEHPRSERLYRRAATLAPDRPEPWVGLGGLARYVDHRELAKSMYRRALEIAPGNAEALAGLARVEIEDGNLDRAEALLAEVRAENRQRVAVLAARSELCFRRGDMAGAVAELRAIVATDPENLFAIHRLARGFVPPDWVPPAPPEVPEEYERAVRSGIKQYEAIDFESAEKALAALDGPRAPDHRPAFYRGLIALRRGRIREAEGHLARARRLAPDDSRVGNAFVIARSEKLYRQRAEYGGGADGVDRLGPLSVIHDGPAVPGLADLVPGIGRLLPPERRAVEAAVRPFADRLARLVDEGVTHEILDLSVGLTDAPSRAELATRRTPDGRWYGGLRGVGGKNAATGIESILDAVALRYHTFAHEFAHQVMQYGLSPTERGRVSRMYIEAREENRTLDSYAARNEREYFAQGYEAFVSLVKSPWLHALRRHTRAELAARDPGLYRFLLEVTGTEDPDPLVTRYAEALLGFYRWAGDPLALLRLRTLIRLDEDRPR